MANFSSLSASSYESYHKIQVEVSDLDHSIFLKDCNSLEIQQKHIQFIATEVKATA